MSTFVAARNTSKNTKTVLSQFNAGNKNISIQLTHKAENGTFDNIKISVDDARWLAAQLNDWATSADRGVSI